MLVRKIPAIRGVFLVSEGNIDLDQQFYPLAGRGGVNASLGLLLGVFVAADQVFSHDLLCPLDRGLGGPGGFMSG